MLASALAVLLTASPATRSSSVSLLGWTRDGRSMAHESVLKGKFGSGAQAYYRFLVVSDSGGVVLHRFQLDKRLEEGTTTAEGEAAWSAAEPAEAGQRWQTANALLAPPESQSLLPNETFTLPPPWDAAGLRVEAGSGKCPAARFVLSIAGLSHPLWENRCVAPGRVARFYVHAAPSPDGARLALGLSVVRVPDRPSPDDPEPQSSTFSILSRRELASIDLLDAGAGTDLDKLADRLKRSGFGIGHRGKAMSKRDSTAIYFAPGFETEARAVAEAVGAAPESVQLLTWRSPFAITVAAGAPR